MSYLQTFIASVISVCSIRGGENATILAVPSNVIEERITIDESDDNDDGINSDNEFGAIDEFSEAEINKAFTDNKSASSSEGGRVRSKPSSGSSAKKSIDRYAVVKASKTMKCVIDTFDTSKLLYARQVAMIVSHFPDGCVMRTDYGSYRVEIVISLFWRIKDIQNFDIILSFLNASEAACVIGRLGLLTIFNPMKPENCYELDMAIYEQRQMVKMLMHYAVVEPGVNWFNQKYSVDRNNVNIPGWELPLMWNLKENLPEKGILCCKYYAGDGFCMKQCRPVKKLRFALLCLSLVCLDELRDEEAEFLLDKEKYRKIEIGDEIYSTPSGNTRKHQAKFVSESRVTGSSIPSKANTLKDLHDWLLKLEVTWNYDNISDSHP